MDIEVAKLSCPAVDGEGLTFYYGRRKKEKVLDSLNISVERGIIYGLLGPSGCGKTTLLRCIVGRHKPSSGTIKIYGRTPGQKGFSIPGVGVGFMPQELALYPEMTMAETLTYFGRVYRMTSEQIAERIAFLTSLLDIPEKQKLIRNLSGGQQRRVSFALALIHKPPLLILDEPTVGVDPVLRQNIWKHLQILATKDHLTVIITTHYVEEARQAHTVGLMRDGHLLAETNPEKLIKQHDAHTLEDVFLKLCNKRRNVEEAVENNCIQQKSNEKALEADGRAAADVWVLREENHVKQENSYTADTGHEYNSLIPNNTQELETLRVDNSCIGSCSAATSRMNAHIIKNLLRLKRNIPLVFFQLFIPAIQLIVFCLCVGGEPFDLPVAVVNMETIPHGQAKFFLQQIDNDTIFQKPYPNLTLAIDAVKRGECWGVIYTGPTFTDSLTERFLQGIYADNKTVQSSTVRLYMDMTNQQISFTIFMKVVESFQQFAKNMLLQNNRNPLLSKSPIVMEDPIYGKKDATFTEFMAPGMILGITYIMAVGLSGMSIIIEKKEGLLDRSWTAGVRSWEVMFSMLFTLFMMTILQVTFVLLFTFLTFDIPSHGNLVWVVFAVLLAGMEGMAYGLLISAICDDENIAVMVAMGSFYPNLLMSGILWPVEAMPKFLRHLSYFLPLTLICHSMRCVLSRGWSLFDDQVWQGYSIAIAWIVVVFFLAGLIFKYRK